VLDLVARGDAIRLVVRQARPDAFEHSSRLREIVAETRRSMPVELRDVDDVLDPDRPYRVFEPSGEDLEIAGDRVRVYRDGALVGERRAPWLERTLRGISQSIDRWRLSRWPSHEERVTLLGLPRGDDQP
jgi:hypothetical protein